MSQEISQRRDSPLVLVTGPSGAGRSTAMKTLEDLRYETIDNLPLSLVPSLIRQTDVTGPLALGLDVRNRDFSVGAVLDLAKQLSQDRIGGQLLYLGCAEDVLVRRFSETRRRHPLAPAESAAQGVRRELDLLGPVQAAADVLIDTSAMTPHDLRDEIIRLFGADSGPGLSVTLTSFSYKRGIPLGADLALDCRFLRNPYWQPELRGLNGCDTPVATYVEGDDRFSEFLTRVSELLTFLLPQYKGEGKAHLSVALGCTGGQHRSVAMVEKLATVLADAGWRVSKRHRELERNAFSGGVGKR
ncbi:glmZ(sRNA)-inactivating NTPase [Actibacterium mucosum KCTC 23349]|uniref:GlmZ(SRNA)-inactivating NTPase n=1 Tax=Actibacterium mucosum KCTC 23349 TaxID=1454373 RepID=A0A037ZQ22_9RHOB|nr:RNase adapter RapZ [Actibacterium mucosum]KAJ56912.1 glmZ(sRNA)-inactivating NTPase [Actibacterium mucosum KCTC 23349]